MNTPPSVNPNMVDNIIFQHFTTLSTAPNGIARLRELILQLAVQGKLGTQGERDEPANKILSKILEEKKRLIKQGTISKPRALPKIGSEEIPFQIPDNWIWLRLDDIGHNWGQKEPDKIFIYIDVTAINKEKGLIGDKINILQPNEAPSRARKMVKKGTVIYSTVRPYLLNIAIIDKDFNPEPIVSTAFAVLHPFEGISNRYLFYYLRSKPFIAYVELQMAGMAYPAINDLKFHMGLVPVPPTAEQHRIVEKVDRLMALCDQLEARQQQERAGCLKLGTASLVGMQNAESPEELERLWAQVCDAFDLILDCPENVGVLRQTILQLAVQGRLVRQDPGDESAEKLVERIRKEKEKKRLMKEGKIKHEKTQDLINEIDTPFIIPKGWTLVSLHELGIFIGGVTPSTGNLSYWNGNIPWVSPKDVKSKYILDSELKITQSALNNNRLQMIPKESIIIVARSGILKRTLPVAITKIECTVNQDIKVIIPYVPIITEYLHLLLKGYEQFILTKLVKGGMTVQSLKYDEFEYQSFPLPPLAEQHRIVAKVDALMGLCDDLEARLMERDAVQGRYANAVVKQVAGGVQ